MELHQAFEYRGWTVKYAALRPTTPPAQLKPLIFVHGTPWSSVTFVPIAKALLARGGYEMVLYDLPGYGQSQEFHDDTSGQSSDEGLFSGDTSVRFQAEALTALLQHLRWTGKDGNPAPSVVAHDIAGTIALRAHLIHGCEFRDLLLMDTNTVLPWGDGFYKLVRSEPEIFLKLPYATYQAVMESVIESAVFDKRRIQEASWWKEELLTPWSEMDKRPAETAQRSFIRQIAQANDTDVAEMLDQNLCRQVRCPVKILWGEKDQWIPKEKMEQLAELLGDRLGEFVVIEEAGHLIMVDQPERVAIEVFSWLHQ